MPMLGADDTNLPPGEPPRTMEEIERACWHRTAAERTPVPVPGERLLFRMDEWGPAEPATVLAVQDMTVPNDGFGPDPDPHIWFIWFEDGQQRAAGLRPDPWPYVTLRLESGLEVMVRESRLRGSAGWLREAG